MQVLRCGSRTTTFGRVMLFRDKFKRTHIKKITKIYIIFLKIQKNCTFIFLRKCSRYYYLFRFGTIHRKFISFQINVKNLGSVSGERSRIELGHHHR